MAAKTSNPATGAKTENAEATAKRKKATNAGAAHIMPAPRGPRTVSHRKIVAAVEAVFRNRAQAGG